MNLGYRQARLLADSPIGPAGATVRGHEFHYSRLVEPGATRRSPSSPTASARRSAPRARGAAGSAAASSTPSPLAEGGPVLEIVVIGIGSGNPEHMTVEAIGALNAADRVLIPRKGEAKADLAELRRAICDRYLTNPATRIVEFDMPHRDEEAGYREGVEAWHREIAGRLPWAARRRRRQRRAAGLGRPVALRQHAAHPRPPGGRRARLHPAGRPGHHQPAGAGGAPRHRAQRDRRRRSRSPPGGGCAKVRRTPTRSR